MNEFEKYNTDEKLIDSYDGVLSATASSRQFLDIEPRISVRSDYSKRDYYRFRPGEAPPTKYKEIIQSCSEAYNKVGIIKNIIDLMADFGSQGIKLVHPNKRIQKFHRQWGNYVGLAERSERFLNCFFRQGTVFINRTEGRMSVKQQRNMTNAFDQPKPKKRVIPSKYNFINPLIVDIKGGPGSIFSGQKIYVLKIPRSVITDVQKHPELLNSMPEKVRSAIQRGDNEIVLDPESVSVYHYKKDDWQLWAHPMIYAIIDDITMLEKMKLADMSALDGAISNIRLWTLGIMGDSPQNSILPTSAGIDKVKNILASNVGGGTMDMVWGPDLKFTESNTQIYKFLGEEKYQPVLNSIYAGLGIPPTLAGFSGASGGYTNNFVSLKTLIERLEYGRSALVDFWNQELKRIQVAMGFRFPAQVHFDHIVLSDEAAEKKLLVDLFDRDLISSEAILERFGEIPNIEKIRVNSEHKDRKSGKMVKKAGPYHNDQDYEYRKISLQGGEIGIQDLIPNQSTDHPRDNNSTSPSEDKQPGSPGRPKNSKDSQKRKEKRVLPRSKSIDMDTVLWASGALKTISDLANPILLEQFNKKNLRELNSKELETFERLKLRALCSLKPFEEVTIKTAPTSFFLQVKSEVDRSVADFINKNGQKPSLDVLRQIHALAYVVCWKN